MDSFDISRISDASKKQHYSSVRMQQGRVILDHDWNENEEIDNLDTQESRIDIIGSYGSPDNGFKIINLRTDNNLIDFDIHQGTMYVSGERFEMENADEALGTPESFRLQKDWLQQESGGFPLPVLSNGEVRTDLVYFEGWQQAISAVEDEELLEKALGGPDTTTRIRNMRRVKIAENINYPECPRAWEQFRLNMENEGFGIINENHELIPDVRLSVDYSELDDPEDLCSPDAINGYLGAENQSIRVELRDSTHFIWGFDNASPYYRVLVTGNDVTFLSDIKDQHSWPLAGQIVEILPWSAVLANGEKVAEQKGHLTRVSASYNPDTQEIIINDALSAGFGEEWTSRSDSDELRNQDPQEYFYLRVWRGISEDEDMLVSFSVGNPVTLGSTGIKVTITGTHLNSESHWIIAARPETPDQVVPWALENTEGIAPHGFRKYYAPIAIIKWEQINDAFQGEIIRDCRKTFRPLTDLETCCTYHVGDGMHSFGDFNSLQDAIDNLPVEGGKICVLPGIHKANASIVNRRNIRISGCGRHSIVVPRPDLLAQPIFTIQGSTGIQIDNLTLFAPGNTAIYLNDTSDTVQPSQEITIGHNRIVACIYGIYIKCKNEVAGSNNIWIVHNKIGMLNKDGGKAGIFSIADDVLIERNRIVLVPAPEDQDLLEPEDLGNSGIFDPCADPKIIYTPNFNIFIFLTSIFQYMRRVTKTNRINYLSQSGLQIGDSSEQVRILENQIIGGSGHGITLGSDVMFEQEDEEVDGRPILNIITNPNEGVVSHAGRLLGGIDLEFERIDDNTILSTRSDSSGKYSLGNIGLGEYRVSVKTGYEIASANAIDLDEFGMSHEISVVAVEVEDVFAFLYNIYIDSNEICYMGNSGIGSYDFSEIENNHLKVIVEDLTVYKNVIKNCAHQVPAEIPENQINEIGFGGIALSYCENLWIRECSISHDDLTNIDPVSGIFIRYGDKIEISGNRILNNGQIIKDTTRVAKKGIRCGIYIGMNTASRFAEIFEDIRLPDFSEQDGIPALKVTNNIVTQFKGQALVCTVIGPTSVLGNQFTSQGIDFKVNSAPGIAGAVHIFNLGISKNLINILMSPKLYEEAKPQNQTAGLLPYGFFLPPGNVMFNNNQTTLDLQSSDIEGSLCSQLIISLDDISYVGNQSDCYLYIDLILSNTILFGITVRSCNNRYKEGLLFAYLSQLSYGVANTHTGNQGTHCFLTRGNLKIDTNNLILFDDFCDNFKQ